MFAISSTDGIDQMSSTRRYTKKATEILERLSNLTAGLEAKLVGARVLLCHNIDTKARQVISAIGIGHKRNVYCKILPHHEYVGMIN